MENLLEILNPEGYNIKQLLGDYAYKAILFEQISMDEMQQPHDIKLGWNKYSPEVVQVIRDYKDSGKYPYNRDIEEMVTEKYGIKTEDLSRIVYNSQQYEHYYVAITNAVSKAKDLIGKGWECIADPSTILGKRVFIIQNFTNIIGAESKHESEKPFTVIKDAAGQYFFIKTARSRKGYRFTEGAYVAIVSDKKSIKQSQPGQMAMAV